MVLKITSDVARKAVIERLRVDLVGPRDPEELLLARPSDVYLTGILWPRNTALSPDEDERLAVAGGGETTGEDTDDQARPAAATMRRPSTAGVSFAVRSSETQAPAVDIEVSFGVYFPEKLDDGRTSWRRQQVRHKINGVEIRPGAPKHSLPVEAISGLQIDIQAALFPGGTIATVTLVNGAATDERGREASERLTIFQVSMGITVGPGTELIARPSRRATVDKDDESAALLYRDAKEYAAGHTCSADWTVADSRVTSVRIAWLPDAVTLAVSSEGHPVFSGLSNSVEDPLSAAWLSSAMPEALGRAVERLASAYGDWIQLQTPVAEALGQEHAEAAARHLDAARLVLARMKSGAERLRKDPVAAAAFRLANLAMETQRQWGGGGSLRWRPFQLGFLLLTIESTIDGSHPDREVMDLLWFPTGGGKTEAYLALIAFAAFYRRLSRKQPDEGAGVAAIMRYTLRLLTTQQFVRAAAMITACEAIRRGRIPSSDAKHLGKTSFSIGLWVGGDATPNRRKEAYDSRADQSLSSPQQLSECPCCHGSLEYRQATSSDPVTIWCRTNTCSLHGAHLPVWTVDDDVYEERPTLVIGTVDKFAQIVRRKETARLFGVGTSAQPQLILQDELHLIAGPLGTLAGLYEAALDLILSANGSRPKIIGSTATIRRADEQVLALFDRRTCQFPPPGLSAEDSGFAIIDQSHAGRCYVGVTTAGRSAKFALQAVMASLLQTAANGLSSGERDPYWTLVAYFNSLRELGGALVLAQDDVNDTLQQLARARNEQARRPDAIQELTSRRTQLEIRDMLNRLNIKAGQAGALDVVLATNMLSVGVDIPRLGLMLVNGQPKTMAEYIQATSRVGRGAVAGLVVPVLNSAKPRDRSHFETFKTWHSTLYRDVEATSVTPFASRARDRALHAVLVAAVRHLTPSMLDKPDQLPADRKSIEDLIDRISERASRIDKLEIDVKSELVAKLDSWIRRSPQHYWWNANVSLMQGAEEASAKRASGRIVGQAWPTPNSLRAVEPATPFRLVERLRGTQ